MFKTRRQFLALARAAGGAAAAGGILSRTGLTFAGQSPDMHIGSATPAGPVAQSGWATDAGGATDAGVAAHSMPATQLAPQRQMLNPVTLTKFVDALPIPAVIPSAGTRPSPGNRKIGLPYYRIEMTELQAQLHRDVPPTRQWGYAGSVPGPTIETQSGQGLLIEWVNKLPGKHFLPVDHTLHGAEADKPEVRTVAHVHGAKVPPEGDGYPESWHVPGQSRTVYYPNEQDASTLWYHDHAMGITRLNIFAGLFGAFIIKDAAEQALNLPGGAFDIPLVLYDRTLDREGQLLYPVSAAAGAPFVSEFYGNALICNGKLFPYLEVQPRKYRFRLLNAANGSFFHLTLAGNRAFHQIGTDLGLLAAPVELRTLVLFPAERAEVVIDFAGLAGETLQLQNAGEGFLQFRVRQGPPAQTAADTKALPTILRSVPRTPESQSVQERILTLSEHDDAAGNSMQMLLNESHWDMPVTENPTLGSTEIWSFVNLAGDAHPDRKSVV